MSYFSALRHRFVGEIQLQTEMIFGARQFSADTDARVCLSVMNYVCLDIIWLLEWTELN